MQSILVIAAHPDDEILGVGGSIRRFVNEGKECRALILGEGLSSRKEKRTDIEKSELDELKLHAKEASKVIGYQSIDFCNMPDNRMDMMELLDIIKIISQYLEKYKPDTVFTHHHGDLNIDHRITCEAVLTACRPVGKYYVKRIYAFETPSSSEWNYNYTEPFNPNYFVEITDTIDEKIKGMSCYKTESAEFPHPRSLEALSCLGKCRGINIGVKVAEAFMCLREVY